MLERMFLSDKINQLKTNQLLEKYLEIQDLRKEEKMKFENILSLYTHYSCRGIKYRFSNIDKF